MTPREDPRWVEQQESLAEDRADERRNGPVDRYDQDRRMDAYEAQRGLA